ncbi:AAA family ATPase [Halobaculum halobium]|uniref:nucleotide-binding protein n=1 Tax=Halobaculum halobium TaxID=3032281 RepID=UPI00360BE32D
MCDRRSHGKCRRYTPSRASKGVGKTTTAANLAATLAAAGYDTVAVDADLGSASLGPSLGVEPGETTLHDVLAGEADPVDATREGPHGLAVLPGGTASNTSGRPSRARSSTCWRRSRAQTT